ncbi:MAG: deoxyguanosinetriphosphate triphosphohydrolase, partial [Olsenella sp.]|nr:deoxyguanosinetriphosphate triphosphohydrolase [Olsenella sp.]MCI2126493.1 deoxyguanosinetriphosphate triphosphohydrolase [Olsenella sp.]
MRVHDREDRFAREEELLSAEAAKNSQSKGRDSFEEEDYLRPCYQRDRDRILHCKSFRRLANKTQVFLAPEGDHYRTRLTH